MLAVLALLIFPDLSDDGRDDDLDFFEEIDRQDRLEHKLKFRCSLGKAKIDITFANPSGGDFGTISIDDEFSMSSTRYLEPSDVIEELTEWSGASRSVISSMVHASLLPQTATTKRKKKKKGQKVHFGSG